MESNDPIGKQGYLLVFGGRLDLIRQDSIAFLPQCNEPDIWAAFPGEREQP